MPLERPLVPPPTVVSLDRDHCIARWKGFLIQLWRGDTTLSAAREVRAAAKVLAAGHAGALATLIVVEASASVPSAEARTELAGMVIDQGMRMVCGATVQEGAGFQGAAVRAVMTGLMLVARNVIPHKVFATVNEACHWMGANPKLGAGEIAELPRVVEEMRARISDAR